MTPRWNHDPFLGATVLEDGEEFVFGRGAIDDKHSLMGILQASAIFYHQLRYYQTNIHLNTITAPEIGRF